MHYVYELRDPRNGIAFYVGKGQGDRAHQHQREVLSGRAKSNSAKIAKIVEILEAGLQTEVVILAEYPFEEDALDHEFHLVDANPNLTNLMPGGIATSTLSPLTLCSLSLKRHKKLLSELKRMKDICSDQRQFQGGRGERFARNAAARLPPKLSAKHADEIAEFVGRQMLVNMGPRQLPVVIARKASVTARFHKLRQRITAV